jgi:alpha/beta superfamily hydrolase
MLSFDRTDRGTAVTAVLLHPHPDFGGDRFHPVIAALYRDLEISTLRFDFSSSTVEAAQADVLAALDASEAAAAVLVGYSFGADIALSTGDPRVRGWFGVAPPLRTVPVTAMAAARDPRPKGLAVPEDDQFSPPDRVAALTEDWPATTRVVLRAADHFLAGQAPAVVAAVRDWLAPVLLLAEADG